MRKLALLGALVALVAVVLPGVAAAGQISGVTVAKDTARHSVAVAVRGTVHTVRTAKVAKLKVGQRLTASGTANRDGTFSARTVKPGARVDQVTFNAVVVRNDKTKQQLIVSAGGSVFGVRVSAATAAFANDDNGLAPGDQVTVSADVNKDKQQLEAHGDDVKETGHVGQVKIVGIFLRGGQDGFDVAIVHRGLVRVHFTLGSQLPPWKPGDIIVLLVTVNDDGSFALVQGQTDSNPGDKGSGDKGTGDSGHTGDGTKTTPPPATFVDASGVLSNRTSTSVTVTRADTTTLTCTVPSTINVSSFAVGSKVGMYCKKTDDGLILQGIKSLETPPPSTTPPPTSFAGTITDLGGSVSVKGDGDKVGTCAVPTGVSLALFHVGDTVKMECALRESKLVLVQLRSDRAWINLATGELGLIGLLGERSTTGVTVNADGGATLHCGIASPVDLGMFSVGQKVALSCKRSDAGLTFALLYGDAGYVKADGSMQRTVYGTLSALSDSSLTVTLEGGSSLTCSRSASTDLAAFHVGDKVKLRCGRAAGADWALSLIVSPTATVEVH